LTADKLLAHKNKVVGKLTGGLSGMAKMRKVTTARGYGVFVGPTMRGWKRRPATARRRRARRRPSVSQAASSRPAPRPCGCHSCRTIHAWWTRPARWRCAQVPKRMLILGGGIIGLEMGTVYSTLGARLDVVEMLDGLMQGADRDLVKVWQKMNAKRFDNVMLKTKTVGAKATEDGIEVTFAEGKRPRRPKEPQVYDLVLQAVGRSPNGAKIGADKAGVARLPTAASSVSTSRCVPMCRTSLPSATSWASRCWRTRRYTRPMWPRK
jgi:dihydrolipoamide dehydrogenase